VHECLVRDDGFVKTPFRAQQVGLQLEHRFRSGRDGTCPLGVRAAAKPQVIAISNALAEFHDRPQVLTSEARQELREFGARDSARSSNSIFSALLAGVIGG